MLRLSIADDEHIGAVGQSQASDLARFDEWRGGCGLSLAIARRIVHAHDGSLWSPATGRQGRRGHRPAHGLGVGAVPWRSQATRSAGSSIAI